MSINGATSVLAFSQKEHYCIRVMYFARNKTNEYYLIIYYHL